MTNLLTVKAACEFLQISRTTFFRLRNDGKIKTVIVNIRNVRVSKPELDRYLSKQPSIAGYTKRGRKPKQVAVDAVAAV
jgi:excisionase family DNA binding protein